MTPVPEARKRKAAPGAAAQVELDLAASDDTLDPLHTAAQKCDPTPIINELRGW